MGKTLIHIFYKEVFMGSFGRISLLSFVFVLGLSLSSAFAVTYINGIDANYPPFAYVDETGKPSGFDVDALDWIAKKMGFEVKHQPMDWDGIVPALLAKKIDMVGSGMSITPAREAQVSFSEPYWTISKVIITKPDSTLTVEETFAKPVKLGVQRGTSEHDYLETMKTEQKLPFELRFYDSAPLAIEDLLNGRIEAVALDSTPAKDAIAKGKNVKIVGNFIDSDVFGVAFRKEDTELRNTVNEGFKALMADPFWVELQDKYLSE